MSESAAILGDYVDLRFIKGRKVCQVVIEVPIEKGNDIVAAFGTPRPDITIPVALARLMPEGEQTVEKTPRVPRRWNELPATQQAAMRCQEPRFQAFMRERYAKDDAADGVRLHCGVSSRAQITDENTTAMAAWRSLESEYQAWLQVAA
jgi:hypothetical protein